MNNELLQVSDFLSVLEIFLLLVVSYIGTIIHEYIFIPGKTKFIKNIRVWLTVIMNFIICYSINPYIIDLNPRLILLPPLVLGLLGNELAVRLGTIKGSTSFIEYILGFFGIKNKLSKDERETLGVNEHREMPKPILHKDEENSNTDEKVDTVDKKQEDVETKLKKEEKDIVTENKNSKIDLVKAKYKKKEEKEVFDNFKLSEDTQEQMKEINQQAYIILNELDNILLEYYEDLDKDTFVSKYLKLKPKLRQFNKDFKQYDYLPLSTTLKISEILDKERDIDKLYRQLVQTSSEDMDNDEIE